MRGHICTDRILPPLKSDPPGANTGTQCSPHTAAMVSASATYNDSCTCSLNSCKLLLSSVQLSVFSQPPLEGLCSLLCVIHVAGFKCVVLQLQFLLSELRSTVFLPSVNSALFCGSISILPGFISVRLCQSSSGA